MASICKNEVALTSVINDFKNRNYTLITDGLIYKNQTQILSYTCDLHPELGVQKTKRAIIKTSKSCKACIKEQQSGSNSSFWRGGVSPLNQYFRTFIVEWKNDSIEAGNYKCAITGESKNWVIHHLYPFNKILKETFIELNLPMHEDVSIYSDSELALIKDKIMEVHYRYPLVFFYCFFVNADNFI